jgi:hypothetical protein
LDKEQYEIIVDKVEKVASNETAHVEKTADNYDKKA